MQSLVRAGLILGFDVERDDNHALLVEAARWVGTPYRNGGNSRLGIDCSGLTCQIYNNVYRYQLPRQSELQYAALRKVKRKKLRQGDLLFFRTPGSGKRCGHVGIYLKEDKFIHAGTSRGVIVESLNSSYWQRYWMSGGRRK